MTVGKINWINTERLHVISGLNGLRLKLLCTLDGGPCEKLERFALSYSNKSERKNGTSVYASQFFYRALSRSDR